MNGLLVYPPIIPKQLVSKKDKCRQRREDCGNGDEVDSLRDQHLRNRCAGSHDKIQENLQGDPCRDERVVDAAQGGNAHSERNFCIGGTSADAEQRSGQFVRTTCERSDGVQGEQMSCESSQEPDSGLINAKDAVLQACQNKKGISGTDWEAVPKRCASGADNMQDSSSLLSKDENLQVLCLGNEKVIQLCDRRGEHISESSEDTNVRGDENSAGMVIQQCHDKGGDMHFSETSHRVNFEEHRCNGGAKSMVRQDVVESVKVSLSVSSSDTPIEFLGTQNFAAVKSCQIEGESMKNSQYVSSSSEEDSASWISEDDELLPDYEDWSGHESCD